MDKFVEVMRKYKTMCDYFGACKNGCPLQKLKEKYNTDCYALMIKYSEEAEQVIMEYEKPVDWSQVEVDTKILVRSGAKDRWMPRHFAEFNNGKVYSWADGRSSFTSYSDKDIVAWKYVKLAKEEKE